MQPDEAGDELKRIEALIRTGRTEQALALLRPICRSQPANAAAWWLAAQALDNPVWKRDALQRVVRANPSHTETLRALALPDQPTNQIPAVSATEPAIAQRPLRQLVGADGELLVPIPPPAPIQTGHSRRFKLVILTLALLLVVGTALVLLPAPLNSSDAEPTPKTFYMPQELYQNALYYPTYNFALKDSVNGPPCKARVISGQVLGGTAGLILHVQSASGQVNLRTTTDMQGNYRLVLPAKPVEPVHVLLYDSQGHTLSGLFNIVFGEGVPAATCQVKLEFKK